MVRIGGGAFLLLGDMIIFLKTDKSIIVKLGISLEWYFWLASGLENHFKVFCVEEEKGAQF